MMKKILIITALSISCFAVGAMAAQGPYVSGYLGNTMPRDSDVRGRGESLELTYVADAAIGAALGYNFGSGRIEAEMGYKIADTDKMKVDTYYGSKTASVDGDLNVFNFMANGYIDFNASSTVKPYLMAGVGMANVALKLNNVDAEDLDIHNEDNVFAYQAGVGVGFEFDKVTLDFSYRFMCTEDAKIDEVDAEYGSHNVLAGVRFQF